MSFVFKRKEHGSINDGAMKNLPVGEHNYRIVEAAYEPVKSDKTNRRKHIKFAFRGMDGQLYNYFIELEKRPIPSTATDKVKAAENEKTRQKIAAETLNALLDAIAFKGDVFKLSQLPIFLNKDVGIRVEAQANNPKYVNIREIVEPYEMDGSEDEEEPEEEETEDESEEEEIEEEETEDESEEEEEEPAPKPKKAATKKAAPKKVAKPKPTPDPEDEDEEGEEEDDDDEPF